MKMETPEGNCVRRQPAGELRAAIKRWLQLLVLAAAASVAFSGCIWVHTHHEHHHYHDDDYYDHD